MKVINRTKDLLTLEIVLANGKKDSVNIQPLGRADLPPGSMINPDKELVYGPLIKKIDDAAPLPTPAPSTSSTEEGMSFTQSANK